MASFVAKAKIKFWSSWQGLLWAWYYCKFIFEISPSFLGVFVRKFDIIEDRNLLSKSSSHCVTKKWQNSTQQQSSRRYFQVGRAYYGRDIIQFLACCKIVISNVFSLKLYRRWEGITGYTPVKERSENIYKWRRYIKKKFRTTHKALWGPKTP